MPKYCYIELWKCLKVSKWSNLKLFTRLPHLLRRGDERKELAYCLSFKDMVSVPLKQCGSVGLLVWDRKPGQHYYLESMLHLFNSNFLMLILIFSAEFSTKKCYARFRARCIKCCEKRISWSENQWLFFPLRTISISLDAK